MIMVVKEKFLNSLRDLYKDSRDLVMTDFFQKTVDLEDLNNEMISRQCRHSKTSWINYAWVGFSYIHIEFSPEVTELHYILFYMPIISYAHIIPSNSNT